MCSPPESWEGQNHQAGNSITRADRFLRTTRTHPPREVAPRDRLEVEHVPDDVVLVHDAVAAQHVAALAGDVQSLQSPCEAESKRDIESDVSLMLSFV